MVMPKEVVTHIVVPVEVVNRALEALVQRPYLEVAELIRILKGASDASFLAQRAASTKPTEPVEFSIPMVVVNRAIDYFTRGSRELVWELKAAVDASANGAHTE